MEVERGVYPSIGKKIIKIRVCLNALKIIEVNELYIRMLVLSV